jgi:glucosamine-6-phosphate deaminase
MRVIIQKDYDQLCQWVADFIAGKINDYNPTADDPFVLGLPTGSSPLGTYKKLIELNKKGAVSFKNVITFNMDEYVGLEPTHDQSYHYFMWSNFFDHIDIPKENVNILNGLAEDLDQECIDYEKRIESYGGIDLFLGGIGPDGHIAFNEPGSSLTSRTRVKTLNYNTIKANSRFFDNDLAKVPKMALTVGVGTVMDSKEVILIINGYNKARALREVLEGAVSHMWTASALQLHKHAILACDDAATLELKTETTQYFKDIERIIENEL